MTDCSCNAGQTVQQTENCCCGPATKTGIIYKPVRSLGQIDSPAGGIQRVATEWDLSDHLGQALVRLGYHRMSYAVRPGLYAVGQPTADSPVFVSANYKLSFDILRRALPGVDGWLLVLDTKGVNVWCAAGKGTFGTAELIRLVRESELAQVVRHRQLIVPQLGASGISAYVVEKQTGFTVTYGPVRAQDIAAFMKNGRSAGPGMRTVRFDLADRLAVSLLELSQAWPKWFWISIILWLLFSFGPDGFQLSHGWQRAGFVIVGLWASILAGSVLTAALLPVLPGRMFSLKGAVAGLLSGISLASASNYFHWFPVFPIPAVSLILLMTTISAYLAMNFTGASTFTSLSGVKKEIKQSMPWIIGGIVLAAVMQILCLFKLI
ncbi:acetyl-CoA synthase subunit gamma [candidate division TA06 bacterium]|uniref:Acetyl-CoA synthase subunit gamma n=1 Tax=candidate division TA06 bacterium TaxID=2250710 RepID=A0A933I833_UNCT6|nr:acetyl-CoA synthase subunit gamma [candidate division TA06 bacterium]